jgi:hypothetical protein
VYVRVGEERVRPRRTRRLYVSEGERKKERNEGKNGNKCAAHAIGIRWEMLSSPF